MSSQPGASTDASRAVTSASSRSPATTSSISRIERSCPIASGVIDCGKTTVSLSGRTGSVAGSSSSVLAAAPGSSKRSRVIARLHRDRDRGPPAAAARPTGSVIVTIAVLVARPRALGVDVLGEPHLALERAVLDLHLLVDAAAERSARGRSPAIDEHPLADDDRRGSAGRRPGSSTTTVSSCGSSVW